MFSGLYIHIPFCKQLCPYCDFAKYRVGDSLTFENYTDVLLAEIEGFGKWLEQSKVKTLYFGGGTPSIYPVSQYKLLFNALNKYGCLENVEEVTLEADPGTFDETFVQNMTDLGVNRWSFGFQSFNNENLKNLGRTHTRSEIDSVVRMARQVRLNFSLDIIFGLKGQTKEDLKREIREAIDTGASHISTYLLDVPEHHKLNLLRPTDEVQAEMFWLIEEELQSAGIFRYEVSNFSKKGFESKHNSLYWNGDAYLGLGLSSHSFLPALGDWGTRFWNHRHFGFYQRDIGQNQNTSPSAHRDLTDLNHIESRNKETLNKVESLNEFFYTSLRKSSGLSGALLQNRYGLNLQNIECLGSLIGQNLVSLNEDTLKLTTKGIPLSNLVFSSLTNLISKE